MPDGDHPIRSQWDQNFTAVIQQVDRHKAERITQDHAAAYDRPRTERTRSTAAHPNSSLRPGPSRLPQPTARKSALAILADRMPDVERHPDIRALRSLPVVDVVAGGFPCQDLSQAGRTAGIGGERSGLVDHALRLVRRRRGGPRWLLLESLLAYALGG